MSVYENVVAGKLKLKGKALDVKPGGIKKKKKKKKMMIIDISDQITQTLENEISEGGTIEEDRKDGNKSKGGCYMDHLTPAERRYMEQRQKIDMQKMAKTSNKSHRDRISEFNQYLANMSEHYDIPKVGPG
ncbi:protein FAM32A-like [Cynara cardunculus var. scolymus]|uniref:protein FAM32A-like n=1 Tax=Cynara cardunculus var. scolymus TaxID=59895 RepID=UPI000D62F67D|nr:protein FAM32A-like [Cynara cardunculus var. scolymus]XP_024995041.1 protein FAM32A-like [Cynara cardunculus var. scolymus]